MTDQSDIPLTTKSDDQLEDSHVTVESEADGLLCCRFCHSSSSGPEGDAMELISPCRCETLIHRRCFDEWSKRINSTKQCPDCEYFYFFEEVPLTWWEETIASDEFKLCATTFTIIWLLIFLINVQKWWNADVATKVWLMLTYVWYIIFPFVIIAVGGAIFYGLYSLLSYCCTVNPKPPRVENRRHRRADAALTV
ncbi:hypothetical protein AeRB84_014126 [Aphanomyces euteiches]|nr:hypothetical protein AeRB84_014126 [Aphanomyces euteiches]